ncbi:hypothetical protein [Thalassoglobus polymorphus]|nr:hypothetical protein [Thalassoglobus polymorphus]
MVRIKYDVRRLWRCPKCHYERRAHASQTAIRCHCEKVGPFMQLVEEQRKVRDEPEELPAYFEYEEAEATASDTTSEKSPNAKSETTAVDPVAETSVDPATETSSPPAEAAAEQKSEPVTENSPDAKPETSKKAPSKAKSPTQDSQS